MVWVAVFALVLMTAAGLFLLGIAAYLLYALVRHLAHGTVVLVRRRVRRPEPVGEAGQPVPRT